MKGLFPWIWEALFGKREKKPLKCSLWFCDSSRDPRCVGNLCFRHHVLDQCPCELRTPDAELEELNKMLGLNEEQK